MPFGTEKLELYCYPIVKNFEDMITRFGRIHEHDGRTDGQTPHDGIGRVCIASRGKNSANIFETVSPP